MNDWLSLTAIARRFQIPEPTARRYAKLFVDFLPHRKIGRMTLYAPDSGSILTRIADLYAQGQKKDDIFLILQKELPKTIDIESSSSVHEETALVRADNSELQEKLFQFLEVVSDQNKKIDALMERDNQTSAEIALVKQQLEVEQDHRRNLETISSQYKQALLKLYHSHKEHYVMIDALRTAPTAENAGTTSNLDARLEQLEEMFLDDMGKLQKLMNQVIQKKEK